MGWKPTQGGSPLSTKGDIHGFTTVDARVPVGADAQVLTADSAEALGIKWAAAAGGAGTATPAYLTGFGEDNLAASLTNSQLFRNVQGIEAQIPVVVTRAGAIVGLAVAASEVRTAGTATFEVFLNGVATGLTAVLDATDTQYAFATQADTADPFVAGDRIDIRVTTDGTWAPTTVDVDCSVVIADDATPSKSYVTLPGIRPPDSSGTGDIEFLDHANGIDPTAAPGMSWGNQGSATGQIDQGRLVMDSTTTTGL